MPLRPSLSSLKESYGKAEPFRTSGGEAASQSFCFRASERRNILLPHLGEYCGYLRRDPDEAPDNDFDGYDFWLAKLNQFTEPGENVRDESVALRRVKRAEMVKSFLVSIEYRARFGL